jgi:mono/diheme cytochrome c family protein
MRCAPIVLTVVVSLAVLLTAAAARPAAGAPQAQKKAAPAKSAAPAENNAIPLKSIPAKNPIAMSENSIKAGRAVYSRICRDCHGLQAKGDGIKAPPGSKPANLIDAEWKYGGSDPEIFKTIKGGVKPFDVMEPWGKKISDTDIWNTINFLHDLAAKAAAKPAVKK